MSSHSAESVTQQEVRPEEVDLRVKIGPLELANPLMTASGTAGLGLEMEPFWGSLSVAGAVVVKTITKKARRGNPMPRLAETPSGLLNSIGLPNKGIDHFIAQVLPQLSGRAQCLIVNLAGGSADEFAELAAQLDRCEGIDALELNVSCPNVEGGNLPFARDPDVVHKLVRDVRNVTDLPVITKLSPNVTDVAVIAEAAKAGGTHAVSLINTILGMSVNWRTGAPGLGTTVGGLSGPAIKPIALRMVHEVVRAHPDLPVIGIGGILDLDDALEFLTVGASAVQIGTAHYREPGVLPRLLAELPQHLASAGRRSVQAQIGTLGAT
ncbi:MAG: dihydroorotate dehydrogenase [Planctomycetota bacterium]|nr:MAG: dihydroorotate dehydrogenase [Planctomycetota bacterium]